MDKARARSSADAAGDDPGVSRRDDVAPGGTAPSPRAGAATRVRIEHRTCYAYDRPVHLSPHRIRLRPAASMPARIRDYALSITPEPQSLHWQEDAWRNRVARAVFLEPTRELTLAATLEAELVAANPFDFLVEDEAQRVPFRYRHEDRRALAACLDIEPAGPRFAAWTEDLRQRLLDDEDDTRTVEFIVAVNQAVADATRYVMRFEPGIQSCERTLELGSGSCRDSGWLLAQALRRFGIATRFVSGYLVQLAREGRDEGDSVALHAWCDAYVPGAGWIGLDATSGLLAAQYHIPLAVAATPGPTAPVQGYADASESRLTYEMHVRRCGE